MLLNHAKVFFVDNGAKSIHNLRMAVKRYRWLIAVLLLITCFAEAKFKNKATFIGRRMAKAPPTDVLGAQESIIIEEPEYTAGNRRLRLKIAPWIRFDGAAPAGEPENLTVQAREVSVGGRLTSKWRWSGGLLRAEWGQTDLYNPMDVVNPRIYLDLLNIEKGASPSLKFNYDGEDSSFEFIYIPTQLPSILPGGKSPWMPREVLNDRTIIVTGAEQVYQFNLPSDVRYTYTTNPQVKGQALTNNGGIKYDRRIGNLDVSMIGFSGAALAPVMLPRPTATLISFNPIIININRDIGIQRVDYRRHTGGLGFVWTVEPVIMKLAGTYSDRSEPGAGIPGWQKNGVFSAEFNHAGPGESTITWLLGASTQSHEGEGNNLITSLDQAFDQALLFGSRWGWGEQASVLMGLISDMRYRSILARLSADFKVRDGLLLGLSVDILDGPPESPIGAYRNNDRANIAVTWIL